MVSPTEALAQGTRHHQAGQLAEAEKIYRWVLAAEPENAQALHLLGTLALQAGQFESAIDLIKRAIRHDRSQAAFYANLGEAYRHAKQPTEAIESFEKAIKLRPNVAHPHAALGILKHENDKLDEALVSLREALKLQPDDNPSRMRLGHILHTQGKLADAEACFRRLLRNEPHLPEPHFNLGSVLQDQEKFDEAAASYRRALALKPDFASAHNNLGVILQRQDAYDEAATHFRACLEIDPTHATAHLNLGTNYHKLDQFDQAEVYYRRAIELEPKSVVAHNALGNTLKRQGKLALALAEFQEAIRLAPGNPLGHHNAASALEAQGELDAALACLEEAARLDPTDAEIFNDMGVIHNQRGRRDETIAACRRAIELKADFPQPYNNIAIALTAIGQIDEAIVAARKSSELSPVDSKHHSNLLYMLNYHPGYSPAAIAAEHRAWAARHADKLTAQSAPHALDCTPERRLRVGYVSAHFMAHAVNFFTEPILASHDHSQVEVFCYSDVTRPDEITSQLRLYADHWRDVAWQNDEQASQLIREDKVDILVDLAGHIGGNRLLLFARKPAPVQVTYIGYQNTTGMAAMDYRLTDEWADPPGTGDDLYTEKLLRLPQPFFCYQPSSDAPLVAPLPALAKGYVTFGSFNAFPKINPQLLDTWARLMVAVPRSRLVILGNVGSALYEHLTRTFSRHGIDVERLTLADRRPRGEYLTLIGQVDIALDPFPFNGHTTTCDALWQGVPVVTLVGGTYAARFGSSAHVNLGLQELIARSPDEYVEIAARLAGDLDRLGRLRAGLRERMAASPLVDAVGFTRKLEAAYRQMWRDRCARQTGQASPAGPLSPHEN